AGAESVNLAERRHGAAGGAADGAGGAGRGLLAGRGPAGGAGGPGPSARPPPGGGGPRRGGRPTPAGRRPPPVGGPTRAGRGARVRAGASLTLSGDLVGPLRYMSPEQAVARRVVIDQRTDVYSLGATLYELLTLRPTFEGKDRQELLRQIAFEEPVPPRRVNP